MVRGRRERLSSRALMFPEGPTVILGGSSRVWFPRSYVAGLRGAQPGVNRSYGRCVRALTFSEPRVGRPWKNSLAEDVVR